MKKKVWILNHYATNQFFKESGRHWSFAHHLQERGYVPTIFCANTRHNSVQIIDVGEALYQVIEKNGIPYVFVRTQEYNDHPKLRIVNMITFYRNVKRAARKFAREHGRPDVILASSVHPLTLVAGIHLAETFQIPCICEIRDLWPESLAAYGSMKRDGLIAKGLYAGEKWIYAHADWIIMTWPGGGQYLRDQGWDRSIPLGKVTHISNGVDLSSFDRKAEFFNYQDRDLTDPAYKNIVYAGSIRKVNNLRLLLDAAKIIGKTDPSIRFLIFGDGNERRELENYCQAESIDQVIFKGPVESKFIPSILQQAYCNIIHNSSTTLDRYGQSQNKLFEYLAAGKCIIQTYTTAYSILETYDCGVSASRQSPEVIAEVILEVCSDRSKAQRLGQNARIASGRFDYKMLTGQLIEVLEQV